MYTPRLDKKKTYCLYEAPSADLIREAAQRLNLPADDIVEVSVPLGPELAPALRLPVAPSGRGCDILIYAKEIRSVPLLLDFAQTLVVGAVGRTHARLGLVVG